MRGNRERSRTAKRWSRGAKAGAIGALCLLLLGACGHLMTMLHGNVEPPPASEFGFGPRVSSDGRFEASIEPVEPLRLRRMQSVKLTVRTADQAPVEGAEIQVDGGMPQHGHGLPTTPRVTRSLGEGAYQVDGVKFNMGGWWELKFHIAAGEGTDSVTFHLDL